jgi:formylglycine-generating enzyme required for sulfatase activity
LIDMDESATRESGQRTRDPRLWAALIGADRRRRLDAARTVRALESEAWYARQLLESIAVIGPQRRADIGESLSALGDYRFSPPYYLPEMLPVPSGVAILGSPDYPDEQPVHEVEVPAFSLAQFPVTHAAYAAFVEATDRRRPSDWGRSGPPLHLLNAPVVRVSARDAEAYCAWIGQETGFRFRLPTEAEWVLAARGVESRRAYPWGDDFDPACANAWTGPASSRLSAVGLFPAGSGPCGHEDMAGNVWEWCSSLYWPYPYHAADGREDPGSDRDWRAMHGGSWRSRPISVRCSARQGELPTDSFEVVGFRLARDESV